MAATSDIEWTDATWQPITGCSIVSPGCTNCYAMRLAGGRLRNHTSRKGLTKPSTAGPVWTGEVRLNEQWLTQPLTWRKPQMIFVCAHGDLFHEDVPNDWIDRIYAVMIVTALKRGSRSHTFQIVTKRSKRQRTYLSDPETQHRVARWAGRMMEDGDGWVDIVATRKQGLRHPKIWHGISAERQKEADERIPDLIATPAAIRFVSAEPLLGPIDFTRIAAWGLGETNTLMGAYRERASTHGSLSYAQQAGKLDWVIVGGESGPKARPMHPDWARSIRDQCTAAGVAFFFKQWGAWEFARHVTMERHELVDARKEVILPRQGGVTSGLMAYGRDAAVMRRTTKKAAGRTLDGREWSEMPTATKAAA